MSIISEGLEAENELLRIEHAKEIRELAEAIRFTVEYIGIETLPPIEGWSWYDALKKYAPEDAERFRKESVKRSERNRLGKRIKL